MTEEHKHSSPKATAAETNAVGAFITGQGTGPGLRCQGTVPGSSEECVPSLAPQPCQLQDCSPTQLLQAPGDRFVSFPAGQSCGEAFLMGSTLGSSTQRQGMHWGKTARVHPIPGTNSCSSKHQACLSRDNTAPPTGNQPQSAADAAAVCSKGEQQGQGASKAPDADTKLSVPLPAPARRNRSSPPNSSTQSQGGNS